ncbi:MAG: DNA-binding response regulator [Bacteroidetes bacterium]|nr:MAG: DNA-binding response regulator [Bacteroidota bacterium]
MYILILKKLFLLLQVTHEELKQMRTIIIDDEPDAVNALKIIIEEFVPELTIIGTFSDPIKALEGIPKMDPELIFLDINMPGLNGFELLESLPHRNFKTIFVTAYDEYAIKAFKYSAVDYILKPIDIDELIDAIKRALLAGNSTPEETDESKYKKLFNTVNNNKHEKLVISTYEGIYYIDPLNVIYIQADSSYSKIIFKDDEPLFVAKGLKEFEELLHTNNFFRNHHSFLINLNFVRKYTRVDGGNIEMTNGDQIPLARRKKNEFSEFMKNIIG